MPETERLVVFKVFQGASQGYSSINPQLGYHFGLLKPVVWQGWQSSTLLTVISPIMVSLVCCY